MMKHNEGLRFRVAPGTHTALSSMDDNRAYYLFSGDLNQMGQIESFLRSRGFQVVKSNVYPGFAKDKFEEFKKALRAIWEAKVDGWWSQDLVKHEICTDEEFKEELDALCKRLEKS